MGSQPGREFISLLRLKEAAQRHLSPTSTTRAVILAEKDILPAYKAPAKFEVFDRFLLTELRYLTESSTC